MILPVLTVPARPTYHAFNFAPHSHLSYLWATSKTETYSRALEMPVPNLYQDGKILNSKQHLPRTPEPVSRAFGQMVYSYKQWPHK